MNEDIIPGEGKRINEIECGLCVLQKEGVTSGHSCTEMSVREATLPPEYQGNSALGSYLYVFL